MRHENSVHAKQNVVWNMITVMSSSNNGSCGR